ncbi:hypothetical protein ACQJBY_071463 [Aegilops geniculata]
MRENGRPSAANLTAGGDAVSHQHAEAAASSVRASVSSAAALFRFAPAAITSAYERAGWRPRFALPATTTAHISAAAACASARPSQPRPSAERHQRPIRRKPQSSFVPTQCPPASRSSMEASDSKQGPEHLIILVHGIMASPSDWTYGEAVLKKRLGYNVFIYGMCVL